MKSYSRSHLSDGTLLSNLATRVSQERTTTADMLADIAEVEDRHLYAPAGYSSMYAYCLEALNFSEDSACKRIRAARAARQFPAIFPAVADGRLHLSGVVLLAPHLTAENADELLAAACHKSKSQIERLLAERSPRPDVPALIRPLSPSLAVQPLAGMVELSAPGRIDTEGPRPKITPLAPQRFALQLTIGQSAHDKLRYVQELLGHQIPSGDLSRVFERLLDLAIPALEKRKFAATSKPRSRKAAATATGRHVPAAVQRAVWERDGGRCTFVSDTGRRCAARKQLEFDHIQEIARGGESAASNLRLLCRTHNQYAAEQTYGPGFMKARRQDAAEKRARAAAQKSATQAAKKAVDEVVPYLRALGCHAREAREVARQCESIPDAPLAERVRLAVSRLGPRGYSPSGAPPRARPGMPAAAAPA